MSFQFGVTHRAPVRWLVLGAAVLLAAPAVSFAQLDNFNDGNDNGWTHYDPIATALGGGSYATYDLSGGTYHITALDSPFPGQVGPARAGSLRNDVTYTGFYTSVDVVNWDPNLDQAFGILARTSNAGPGQTNSYAFTHSPRNSTPSIDISRLTNESPDNISPGVPLILDPARDYRFVFTGAGTQLRGQVFDLADLSTPLATATATDATYASGVNGLVLATLADDNTGRADATFDNYVATRPGDATLDGTVNLADFGRLRANFNSPGPNGWEQADFNLDGLVNLADFGVLRANFGQSVPTSSSLQGVSEADWAALAAFEAELVPEPGAAALLGLLGGVGLLGRRRG